MFEKRKVPDWGDPSSLVKSDFDLNEPWPNKSESIAPESGQEIIEGWIKKLKQKTKDLWRGLTNSPSSVQKPEIILETKPELAQIEEVHREILRFQSIPNVIAFLLLLTESNSNFTENSLLFTDDDNSITIGEVIRILKRISNLVNAQDPQIFQKISDDHQKIYDYVDDAAKHLIALFDQMIQKIFEENPDFEIRTLISFCLEEKTLSSFLAFIQNVNKKFDNASILNNGDSLKNLYEAVSKAIDSNNAKEKLIAMAESYSKSQDPILKHSATLINQWLTENVHLSNSTAIPVLATTNELNQPTQQNTRPSAAESPTSAPTQSVSASAEPIASATLQEATPTFTSEILKLQIEIMNRQNLAEILKLLEKHQNKMNLICFEPRIIVAQLIIGIMALNTLSYKDIEIFKTIRACENSNPPDPIAKHLYLLARSYVPPSKT